eukprot:Plantae.Rhodophyta-Rhodochaete_pulchella.ctg57834.p1 GENE.Plantae.Rhodophyta-Rhodochaete_pulchella.ctg57834~~Plantae.Rhodophyta-Rhodochaete_pulchella.ctg57834.p1  ORF type:complete len:142 (+),score=15.01 Plantae.Rhodophyta-Rhodochaete_pulchella.ctg57834:3-428(+)
MMVSKILYISLEFVAVFSGNGVLARSQVRSLEVMERCVLNFHPALYEAFGMTIVECAAMGCPSVIHTGQVGASELLPTKEGMTIAVDMTDLDSAAVVVRELLTSRRDYLRQVGEKARNRALAWDEDSHAHSIYSFLSGDDK